MNRVTSNTLTKYLTQRLVLRLVSKVFDPICVVAPFTVGARLLLKDIWGVRGQPWDEELLGNTVEKFLECSAELSKLAELTILIRLFSENFEKLKLCIIGDSKKEFSAPLHLSELE